MTVSRVPTNAVDHVGSLKRPPDLVQTWRDWEAGKVGFDELREIQDRAIRDAVKMQEKLGLADRYRRRVSPRRLVARLPQRRRRLRFPRLETHIPQRGRLCDALAGAGRDQADPPHAADRHRGFQVPARRWQASASRSRCRRRRTCISASSRMRSTATVYPDVEQYWDDMIAVFRQEIDELYAAGCRYLQLDEVPLALLCDPKHPRAWQNSEGDDPDKLVDALHRRAQSRGRQPPSRPDDRHASLPRQHGRPLDGRWRLRPDCRGAVHALRRRRVSA